MARPVPVRFVGLDARVNVSAKVVVEKVLVNGFTPIDGLFRKCIVEYVTGSNAA